MGVEVIAAVVVVFASVALITGTIASLVLARSSPEHKRLRAVATTGPAVDLLLEQQALTETPDPFLHKLSRALPRSPRDMGYLRRRLALAGIYSFGAAVVYSFAELVLPIVLAALAYFLIGGIEGILLAVAAGAIGYAAPGIWLGRRITLRQKTIRNGLPDALDLFIVCMEAGCSLDQAIVKASDELEITHAELTKELRHITTEIRAGKPRLEALKNFAKRTGVDDVRSLVAMLVQTDRFGTSIAQALRTHASTARTKRRQLAEERAGRIGVKLVFPLVFCLFPAVYAVCMGPVVVRIYRAFL
jgi:tight adherence protein C